MGQRVAVCVGVRLHGDASGVLFGRLGALEVGAGATREQGREGEVVDATLPRVVRGPSQVVAAGARRRRGLNLGPDDQGNVVASLDGIEGRREGQAARCAGTLDPHHGLVEQARVGADDGCAEVTLVAEQLSDEVADPGLVDVGRRGAGGFEGTAHGSLDVLLEGGVFALAEVGVTLPHEVGVLLADERRDVTTQHESTATQGHAFLPTRTREDDQGGRPRRGPWAYPDPGTDAARPSATIGGA